MAEILYRKHNHQVLRRYEDNSSTTRAEDIGPPDLLYTAQRAYKTSIKGESSKHTFTNRWLLPEHPKHL